MAVFFRYRLYILFAFIFLFFLFGFSLKDYINFIDYNIIILFLGTYIIAEGFFLSEIPKKIAFHLINKAKTLFYSIIIFSILSGFLSSILENTAVVLILAPLAYSCALYFKTSPLNFIIPICLSSNLQGSATLIGDPPSMILAEKANLKFLDFFFFQGKPSLFFAVQIGFFFSLLTTYFILKREKDKELIKIHPEIEEVNIPKRNYIFLIILLLFILTLIIFPRIIKGNGYLFYAGLISLFYAFLTIFFLLIFKLIKPINLLKMLDYETTLFLIGIFILIGIFEKGGGLTILANLFNNFFINFRHPIFIYIFILFISLLFSSFMDNIPFFLLISELIKIFYPEGNMFYLLMFGSLIATTVGGNITPFGAQANIVGVGYLKRKGTKVRFFDFFKLGLPFSLAGTIFAGLFIYLFWK
ncbi:MAG: anion permease [candidate division WOR-3 bacterium]|nr:anion permease [candidate division WOR-3 bacterium]